MKRQLVLLSVLLALCGVSTGNAAIHVTVGNASILPGGTTSIDVFVTATELDIKLSGFGFELNIDTPYGAASTLAFLPGLNYGDDANYVFKGLTFWGPDGDPYGEFGGQYPHGSGFYVTWIGFDFAEDEESEPLYKELVQNENYLLARLSVQHSYTDEPGYNPMGHEFTISLVVENDNTFFWDEGFEEIAFTSSSGTVSVIPEPGSLLIFVGLGLCAIPYLRRRSRRAQRA